MENGFSLANALSGKGVMCAGKFINSQSRNSTEGFAQHCLQLGVLEKYFGKKGENKTCEGRDLFIYSLTLTF